ncbi:MAG: LacI family DNA-binding transcriptional regulator [Spirosomataceae bacterium]
MKSKAPTLKDIAQQLGISISTVSRALRGMPEVNAETREAVLKLSKEVDYEPNMLATSLLKKAIQSDRRSGTQHGLFFFYCRQRNG